MEKKICNYCQKEISKYGCACAVQDEIKILENKKLSSVDWLEYRYKYNRHLTQQDFKVAKAMHKEQVVKAFDEGQECEYQVHINSAPKYDSETYYNETFIGEQ